MNEQLLNQGRPLSASQISVKNVHTLSLAKGTPVVFKMSGTRDGFDVYPASGSAALQSAALFAGILLQDLAVNSVGAAAVKGPVDDVKYIIRSRAGTTGTDSWATEAALSIGQAMSLNTAQDALETCSAAQAEMGLPAVCVAETVETVAGAATTTATAGFGTKSVSTGSVKVFLRLM
jgi:hypothetical protein